MKTSTPNRESRDAHESGDAHEYAESRGAPPGVSAAAYPVASRLDQLPDDQLLLETRRMVGRSNQLLAELLAHLGEVEARGIHRTRACASLYTYCIYELRLSEDAAFRRVRAARWVRQFPRLFEAIASGELHLTGLLLLGPHLTQENLREVLARAKHRTKKEIERLVRVLDPLPDAPARIEPLGPALPASPATPNPSWETMMLALAPVRELTPGDRPRDWLEAMEPDLDERPSEAPSDTGWKADTDATDKLGEPDKLGESGSASALASAQQGGSLGPQRYKVQFTARQEYVDLLEEARALLAHALPNASLEAVQLRALRLLVADLKRRKYALVEKPRTSERVPHSQSDSAAEHGKAAGGEQLQTDRAGAARGDAQSGALPTDRAGTAHRDAGGERPPTDRAGAARGCEGQETAWESAAGPARSTAVENPRQRGRAIPASVRRAVWQRDGGRCTYVNAFGRRCHERSRLELHHVLAFARGGPGTEENVALRCRAHNVLAAEHDFGRAFVQERQRGSGTNFPARRTP